MWGSVLQGHFELSLFSPLESTTQIALLPIKPCEKRSKCDYGNPPILIINNSIISISKHINDFLRSVSCPLSVEAEKFIITF